MVFYNAYQVCIAIENVNIPVGRSLGVATPIYSADKFMERVVWHIIGILKKNGVDTTSYIVGNRYTGTAIIITFGCTTDSEMTELKAELDQVLEPVEAFVRLLVESQ